MERKLYRGIMTPCMVLTIVTGRVDVAGLRRSRAAGSHAKLVLVAVLVAYHFWLGHLVRSSRATPTRRSHVFYRWINELPLVLLVAIVILVVVKPF